MKTDSKEKIFDIVLSDALKDCMDIEIRELTEAEPHTFSDRFEKKMRRIIHSLGRKNRIKSCLHGGAKVIVTAAAVFGVAFGVMLTQPTVYAAVKNVIRTVFDTHDKFTYQGSFNSNDMPFDNTLRPEYIPEGYDLRSIYFGYGIVFATYESTDEKTIDFEYGFADGASVSVDNERHILKEITKKEQTYYFYEAMEENDLNMLIWYSGEFFYDIDARLPEDEMLKIAESVK